MRKSPLDRKLQKMYGLSDERLRKIQKAAREQTALDESGLQFVDEAAWERKTISILRRNDIIPPDGAYRGMEKETEGDMQ